MVTAQRAEPYGLAEFLDDLKAAVKEESDPAATVARVEACLRELLKRPDFLTEEQMQVGADGKSAASSLYKAPNGSLTVRAVVFPEGKPTPVHDHLTWGMVGVYQGVERETRYRRVDDGSREGYAEIVEIAATDYPAGEVTTFIPPNDIHRVEAVSPVKSVSIHIYGTDMEALDRHRFDLATGQILPFRSQPAKR
jgi:3-mercaptopropionate dioxygenase